MPAVVISRSLRLDIGDRAARELGTDFLDYKTGRDSFGDLFGRDKAHTRPAEAVEHELWHVHLGDNSVIGEWDSLWRRGLPQDKFTSDKILVYGYMRGEVKSPWLLLSVLSPFGHTKMDDDLVMRAIAAEYADEKGAYSLARNKNEWIVIG